MIRSLKLGHFFGTSPAFWLNLQSLYELRLAEQRAGKTIKALPKLGGRKGRREPQPTRAQFRAGDRFRSPDMGHLRRGLRNR